jgi:hypothetical protein
VLAPIDNPAPPGLKVPLIVRELCNVTMLVLVIESPFKAVTLVGKRIPGEVPPKTRLDEDVVVRFAGVPAIAGPFSVSVLAPTAKVPDVSVSVLPIVTLPHNVTALLIVRLLSVTAGKFAAPEPPTVIFDVAPPERAPQLICPLSVSVFAPIDKPAPEGLNVPLTVREFCKVTIFELVIESPFKAVTLEGIRTPAEVPPNTRLDADVVERFEGVPAIVGPLSVSIFPPTARVPEVSVRVPLT